MQIAVLAARSQHSAVSKHTADPLASGSASANGSASSLRNCSGSGDSEAPSSDSDNDSLLVSSSSSESSDSSRVFPTHVQHDLALHSGNDHPT